MTRIEYYAGVEPRHLGWMLQDNPVTLRDFLSCARGLEQYTYNGVVISEFQARLAVWMYNRDRKALKWRWRRLLRRVGAFARDAADTWTGRRM